MAWGDTMRRDPGGFYGPSWEIRIIPYLKVDLLLLVAFQYHQG